MSKKIAVASGSKKLKIQIGVCKRMLKEVLSYEKEVITNEARVQKMRDDGRDTYDIRKQEEVLQESYMMIPDSKGRCEVSISDLASILEEFSEDTELEVELLNEAKQIIAQQEEA
mmetsp:Transcript_32244/g.30731  ORF Transcript_32244/g.30731 Transcript_32244/m.30731 type:complete len:115 (-) Transcript_32244:529-873(-)|eukprot:CAMPEP_0119041200 /NCGR_PEP_ID=MMETSP1177-20130426/11389_1 /TAXON_ID=2985 /ORGANISM="Ochromonas sp, Strain CCMP1899" /LENGTH=114 /DNA_ID=CAMNT_0007007051 /DNA_START=77 /DNA_END=421 /DNA_ORIENTATION=-